MTVLMAVKNGENYIRESMESVLRQTFTEFEFLIFDDCSSDNTVEIIKGFNDDRIKFFTGTEGYIANLNRGIALSKGKYIARMDHDDIMHPTKLGIQLEIMERFTIDLCATWVYLFGEWIGGPTLQETSETGLIDNPLQSLLVENYIHHSTVMLRKEFLMRNNLRYEDYFPADDYKLWTEIAKKNGRFYMVPKALLSYRLSRTQAGHVYETESAQKVALVQQEIKEYLAYN